MACIPYRTEEGTADFHVVGWHTHITELLRNGASLVEARGLSRHSDIRMTMRYTHIGLGDQARAIAGIPAPRTPPPHQREEESWECIGSKTCGKPCHLPSSAGNTVTMELATLNDETPCGDRGLDAVCPPVALDGTDGEKWRRRESNPRPAIPQKKPLRAYSVDCSHCRRFHGQDTSSSQSTTVSRTRRSGRLTWYQPDF